VTGGGLRAGLSFFSLAANPASANRLWLIPGLCCHGRERTGASSYSPRRGGDQIRLRALRLGLATAPVELAAETSVEDIVATLSHGKRPSLVVIDSIQIDVDGADRIHAWHVLAECVRRASSDPVSRDNRSAVILVGHVTKDGQNRGPGVVEHMVTRDFFEGEAAATSGFCVRSEPLCQR